MAPQNPLIDQTIEILRKAHAKSKAPLWRDLEEKIVKPRSHRPEVNVAKIARTTKKGAVVIVPGKVLGDGEIAHRVVVGALSFSQRALAKIRDAGGEAYTIRDLVKKYPDGSGVLILAS